MSKPTQAPRLKLVVRRLPPTLPEETFWRVVAPFVDGKSLWRRYVPGWAGDNYGTHPVHSRAYVLMADPESLVAFHSGFDGHVFRSKTGAEYQAVVEFAPVERTPYKAKVKHDNRQGTIDDDPDYLSFLESLSIVVPKPLLEVAPTAAAQTLSTPIIEALRAAAGKNKAKAAKKKDKEKTKAADGAKTAALAAISEAANRRAPKDKTADRVMVAGKGRQVFVAPPEEPTPGPSTEKDGEKEKKKQRSKKKKDKIEDGPSTDPVTEEASTDSKRGRGGRGRGRGRGAGPGGDGRPMTAGDAEGDGGAGAGGGRGRVKGPARGVNILSRGGADGGPVRGRGRGRPAHEGVLASEARIDM